MKTAYQEVGDFSLFLYKDGTFGLIEYTSIEEHEGGAIAHYVALAPESWGDCIVDPTKNDGLKPITVGTGGRLETTSGRHIFVWREK